jgi:hypothetical protein
VRPKHVLIEFEKWMCYIDGRKNKYSASLITMQQIYLPLGKMNLSFRRRGDPNPKYRKPRRNKIWLRIPTSPELKKDCPLEVQLHFAALFCARFSKDQSDFILVRIEVAPSLHVRLCRKSVLALHDGGSWGGLRTEAVPCARLSHLLLRLCGSQQMTTFHAHIQQLQCWILSIVQSFI